MASLFKNGTELARITVVHPATGEQNERQTDMSFRSNGAILTKLTVVFPERSYDQRHSYGWKLHRRPGTIAPAKVDALAQSVAERQRALSDATVTLTTPHPTRVTRTGNPVQTQR